MTNESAKLVYEVIKTRRSVRSFTEEIPPKSFFDQLVDVGRWAPTPGNVQSWRFVTVRDPTTISILRDVSPGFPKQATCAIVLCSDSRDVEQYAGTTRQLFVAEEASMAAQNMLLMAHAMGFGSCIVGSFSRAGLSGILEIPDHIEPVLIVALGVPSQQPSAPERKPLDSITYEETCQVN